MSKQEAVLRTNYWSGVSRKGKQKCWQDRENLQCVFGGPNPVQPKITRGRIRKKTKPSQRSCHGKTRSDAAIN